MFVYRHSDELIKFNSVATIFSTFQGVLHLPCPGIVSGPGISIRRARLSIIIL